MLQIDCRDDFSKKAFLLKGYAAYPGLSTTIGDWEAEAEDDNEDKAF